MLLNEIDFKTTSLYVDKNLKLINKKFKSGKLDKENAIKQASEIYNNLKTEIRLADVPKEELENFLQLILYIKVFIGELENQ